MESSSLNIHWPYVLLALVTLWFPRQWMRFGKIRRKRRKQRELFDKFAREGGADPEDKSVRLGRELANKRNYLDFFRGVLGAYSFWHFSVDTEAINRETRPWFLVAGGLIMLVGILLQSVRWNQKVTFYAPIFFLAGVSMGMGNLYPAALAFLLVCAINPVIPNPRLFITLYGILLLPFNFLLGEGGGWHVLLSSSLVFAIPLFSLLAGRPVVIFTKRSQLGW